eukprot:SM000034S12710  [mRNA]  locus=s34:372921:376454:+ [translate_table: standard]
MNTRREGRRRDLRMVATSLDRKQPARASEISCALLTKESYGAAACQGTERPLMEDMYAIEVDSTGSGPSFFGVFDGHGGDAVAVFLKSALWPVYKQKLAGLEPMRATFDAFLEVDQKTLVQPKGFFGGMRERGLGGSKCGATAATAVLLAPQGGRQQLVAANVGDSRVVMSRRGQAIQLTVDHKIPPPAANASECFQPNVEAERKRIEAKNPTPKKPLVVDVNGTWRVGGLLALSRAFGDVYLKDWSDGVKDGASGGFGLTAEPTVVAEDVSDGVELLILATDGFWDTVSNQEAVDLALDWEKSASLELVSQKLVSLAQQRGTGDDVTVIVNEDFEVSPDSEAMCKFTGWLIPDGAMEKEAKANKLWRVGR